MARAFWRGDPHERTALTRRDWIVVVLVLGLCWVLGMMMFPAVNGRIGELGQCSNNLSSVGKAISVHQAISGGVWPVVSTEPVDAIPGNVVPMDDPADRRRGIRGGSSIHRKVAGYSWIVGLLPNLDENNMFMQIQTKSDRFKRAAFDPALIDDEGKHFSQTTLKVLQCPVSGTTGSQAPEYRAMAQKLADKNARELPVAVTNFVAVSATQVSLVMDDATPGPDGVIYFAKKGVTKIPDGDENTIVLTETIEPNYAAWFDGTTAWVVAHDPNSTPPVQRNGRWECDEATGCRTSLTSSTEALANDDETTFYRRNWAGKEPWRYGPSSQHNGGLVNHLFGDKRVVTIRATGPTRIDASVYLALVTRDGGEKDRVPE